MLKLGDCQEDKTKVPTVKTQETAAETTARDKAEEEKKRHGFRVWCELVQCLDKGSINFIRLSEPDGVAAWKTLVGKKPQY